MAGLRRVLLFAAVGLVAAGVSGQSGVALRSDDGQVVEAPVPEGALPTSVETTAVALNSWIEANPDASGLGGVNVTDAGTVEIYWKGSPPDELRSVAAQQPAPVRFESAAYSLSEIDAAERDVAARYSASVATVGAASDFSGMTVGFKSSVADWMDIAIESAVPVVERSGDAEAIPASRNADAAPWYGGSLIRSTGVSSPQACTTGAAVSVGSVSYVTTAYHCGLGTWYSQDGGHVLGTITARRASLDIQLMKASSWPRIYNGPWNTNATRTVYGAHNGAPGMRVWASTGIEGVQPYQLYVLTRNTYWYVYGIRVGPGFEVGVWGGLDTTFGWFRGGDSGSPLYIYTSSGQLDVLGFLSAARTNSKEFQCPPGHPNYAPGTHCWSRGIAVYAPAAIGTFGGRIKTDF